MTPVHDPKSGQGTPDRGEVLTPKPYDDDEVIKIIVAIDGALLDVQFPPDSEVATCDGNIKEEMATIRYGRPICDPPCKPPKECRMVKVNGTYVAKCVKTKRQ